VDEEEKRRTAAMMTTTTTTTLSRTQTTGWNKWWRITNLGTASRKEYKYSS
jgi:hypothetical protein